MSIEKGGLAPEQKEMKKPQEIERKFTINIEALPDLNEYSKKEIIQGYVSILDDGTETRVRKTKKPNGEISYVKTTKSGGGEIRSEEETEISKEEFDSLWSNTKGRVVEKTRYEIPYQVGGKNYKVELDVYHGKLNGMVSAEVEFSSPEESKNFNPPEWFKDDVTENKEYKNKNLATKGLPRDDS